MSICPTCAQRRGGDSAICRDCGYSADGSGAKLARMLLGFAVLTALVVTASIERTAIRTYAKQHSAGLNKWLTTPEERGEDLIRAAQADGLVVGRPSLIGLTVDRARWAVQSAPAREALLSALAHSAYGRELAGDEQVRIYVRGGGRPIATKSVR